MLRCEGKTAAVAFVGNAFEHLFAEERGKSPHKLKRLYEEEIEARLPPPRKSTVATLELEARYG